MSVERLQSAAGGLNTDASPDYVGATQAPVHTNLLSRPGKLIARGGITNGTTLGASQDAISNVLPSAGPQAVTITGFDTFNRATGALAASSADVGGTWSGAGDATDFNTISADQMAERNGTGATARWDRLSATNLTNVAVQANISAAAPTAGQLQGIHARYIDTSNHLRAVLANNVTTPTIQIIKRIAGTDTVLATLPTTTSVFALSECTIRLVVTATGQWSVYRFTAFVGTPQLLGSGSDVDLATAGTLASGGYGLYDLAPGSSSMRYYGQFKVWVPTTNDALVGFWADTFNAALPYQTKTAAKTLSGTSITLSTARAAPTTRAAQLAGSSYAFGGQTTSAERYLLRYAPDAAEPQVYLSGTTPTAPVALGRYADVITHLERLFVLGTTLGVTGGPQAIMWCDPGNPGPINDTGFAAWRDDVSGLTNIFTLPTDDLPVAFGEAGTSLAIFSERSIWMLFGSGPSNWGLRRVASGFRVLDHRGVCSLDDAVYALTDQGLVAFDGSVVSLVSGDVQAELSAAVTQARTYRDLDNTGYGCVEALPGGYLLVSVGRQIHNAPDTATTFFAGLYDLRRKVWTRFSTSVSTAVAPTHIVKIGGGLLGFDGRSVYTLDQVGIPAVATVVEDDDPLSANNLRIPLKWATRLARLAAPSDSAAVRRILVDYRFDSGVASGWFVKALDGLGNTLMAEQQVAKSPAGQARVRSVFDIYGEASDLQVTLEWRGTWTSGDLIAAAELHDINIEFDPAAQRGSGM